MRRSHLRQGCGGQAPETPLRDTVIPVREPLQKLVALGFQTCSWPGPGVSLRSTPGYGLAIVPVGEVEVRGLGVEGAGENTTSGAKREHHSRAWASSAAVPPINSCRPSARRTKRAKPKVAITRWPVVNTKPLDGIPMPNILFIFMPKA